MKVLYNRDNLKENTVKRICRGAELNNMKYGKNIFSYCDNDYKIYNYQKQRGTGCIFDSYMQILKKNINSDWELIYEEIK